MCFHVLLSTLYAALTPNPPCLSHCNGFKQFTKVKFFEQLLGQEIQHPRTVTTEVVL